MIPRPDIGRLHVITDVSVQNRFDHEELARRAVAGGADVIQVRDKHAASSSLIKLVARVRSVCEPAGVPVIVNDHVDVAAQAGAEGVHLGQHDADVAEARRTLGPSFVIGASAGNLEEALAAQAAGADYIGFGHIYPTGSKPKSSAPVGPAALGDVCRALRIPVIAIGGIDLSNIDAVLDAGAWGVAVIGAVCAAPDPAAATRALRQRIARATDTA